MLHILAWLTVFFAASQEVYGCTQTCTCPGVIILCQMNIIIFHVEINVTQYEFDRWYVGQDIDSCSYHGPFVPNEGEKEMQTFQIEIDPREVSRECLVDANPSVFAVYRGKEDIQIAEFTYPGCIPGQSSRFFGFCNTPGFIKNMCSSSSVCTLTRPDSFEASCLPDPRLKGDPHVIQGINGADRELCFSFGASPGSEYLFYKDSIIEVWAKFKGPQTEKKNKLVRYIGEVEIEKEGVQIQVNTTSITTTDVNGINYYPWAPLQINGANYNIFMDANRVQINVQGSPVRVVVNIKGKQKRNRLNMRLHGQFPPTTDGIIGSMSNLAQFYQGESAGTGTVYWMDMQIPVTRKKKCWEVDRDYHDQLVNKLELYREENFVM